MQPRSAGDRGAQDQALGHVGTGCSQPSQPRRDKRVIEAARHRQSGTRSELEAAQPTWKAGLCSPRRGGRRGREYLGDLREGRGCGSFSQGVGGWACHRGRGAGWSSGQRVAMANGDSRGDGWLGGMRAALLCSGLGPGDPAEPHSGHGPTARGMQVHPASCAPPGFPPPAPPRAVA